MRKSTALLFTLILSASGALAQSEDRPIILLVVGDDLAFGDVGFEGSVTQSTIIDALVVAGALFTRVHASPVGAMPRGLLLTGYDPVEIGLAAFDY